MSFTKVAAIDRRRLQLLQIFAQVAVILVGVLLPILLMTNNASAAPLTARSLQLGTSKITTSSTWTYSFTTPATTNIGSLKFEVCTTPLSTCTSPGAGLNVNAGSTTLGSGWTSANAFTTGAGSNNCTAAANVLCTARATAASETAGARTLTQTLQVNPTAVGTFFVRITTYTDNAYTTSQDNGVVAAATVSQLTVNARIQEVLEFCVGTTAVDDGTTTPGAACANITGTTVDIGILDPSVINVSPVATNGGSSTNGIAMVRTNGQGGVIVTYFTEQDTSSGTLKVTGASCGSTTVGTGSNADQCINHAATQATFTAGIENFGMTVAGVNCVSTTAYTCLFTSGTYNLVRDTNYDGNGGNTYGASGGYAWNSSTTPATLASSTASSVKQVDDEALILKFASTPNLQTPSGAYTVVSTYIATSTY